MTAIDVKGLTHRYGRVTALRDVSFQVREGSLYALLGPNGSGKTTLLKTLVGLLRPTHGAISLFGKSIERATLAQRAQVSYIAEGLRLPGWMTLHQLEGYLAPLYTMWDQQLAHELRRRFRLDPHRKIKTLSRGEHMKAALLVSLAPRPRLLLMDEPFTGMDVIAKDDLVRGLLEFTANQNWTVIISSHDISELETLADTVGFLDHGHLVVSEPVESLYKRFRHVDVLSANGGLSLPRRLPPEWLSVQRAGPRLSFVLRQDAPTDLDVLEKGLSNVREVEQRPASLREIFIALADQQIREGVMP